MSQIAQYLVVIYTLEQSQESPIATGQIAQEIDRSPSATTEMIQRLEADNLVEHEPYTGVKLTETGRNRARKLYVSYRTLCRFFRDVLDLEDYRDEAFELVGTVSPIVTQRLADTIVPAGSDKVERDISEPEGDG